ETIIPTNVHLRSVDGEHTATMPPMFGPELGIEAVCRLVKKDPHEAGGDLVSCLAEGWCRQRRCRRKLEAERPGLVPEGCEKMPVAASRRIGDHVEQHRHHERRSEWPTTAEVPLLSREISGLLTTSAGSQERTILV